MHKGILFIITLLLLFISCGGNPCTVSIFTCENFDGFEYPEIYWIKFYPTTAKTGDTVMVMYEKEIKIENLNYDTDFEITNDGKIKYTGTQYNPYFCIDEDSRILNNILYIYPQKKYGESKCTAVKVNNFISFSNSSASSSANEIVTLEFKVPEEAKSGYLCIRSDLFWFKNILFSDQKLIIVDENGEVVER